MDTTKTGYDLGDPALRRIANPERSLSQAAVCILRALMHSAFIWACCNNERNVLHIANLVKPRLHPGQLPEFFWRQLEKDIELLGQATGKGQDEAVIIIHLVLKDMLTKKNASMYFVVL